MKTDDNCIFILLILLISMLTCPPTSRAADEITAIPDTLKLSGQRGDVKKRNVLLFAKAPCTGLTFIATDLVRESDNAVLASDKIKGALSGDGMIPGGFVTAPVSIDFHDASSGEFKGEILIKYEEGTLPIPVTVQIKDPFWQPLLVLLAGVLLGMAVSVYRSKGKPRDEILVRIEQVRSQMKSDPKFAGPFQNRIDGFIIDADAALQSEKFDEAEAAMSQAEAVMVRWRKGRQDWIEQFAFHQELEKRVEDMDAGAACALAVRRRLKDVVRDAPDEGPDMLRERLSDLGNRMNDYFRLHALLEEFKRRMAGLGGAESVHWAGRLAAHENALYAMSLEDADAADALRETIVADMEELKETPRRAETLGRASRSGEAESPAEAPRLTSPAPTARTLPKTPPGADARFRIRLFTWATYGIAVLLLAGAGYGELYMSKATFGADPWGDYFSLIAWGFGAEASRASVAEMVKGWGLGL